MKATFKSRYLFSTVEPCLLLPVVLFYEKYYETVKKLILNHKKLRNCYLSFFLKNCMPWENGCRLISCKIVFEKIVGKFSVNVRNIFVFAM